MSHTLLTRRQLLASTAFTGTTLLFSRSLPAAEKSAATTSFIIVSDTHLGRGDSETPEKQWRQAVSEINALPAELVIHLGDIVDQGREEQYPIYAQTRELLNKPIYEIPGNHDPDELFRQHISQESDRSIVVGDVRFVLFDNSHRDSHDGFITSEQIEWLREQCEHAENSEQLIIICCHVPIHTNRHPDRGWYVKPSEGQTAFYELQRKYSTHMLACLHGHFHNGIRGWRDHDQTVEVLCPSVCYNQNRGLVEHLAKGSAEGFFVDELRPGYVIAQLGEGQFSMRYKPLGSDLNGTYQAEWP